MLDVVVVAVVVVVVVVVLAADDDDADAAGGHTEASSAPASTAIGRGCAGRSLCKSSLGSHSRLLRVESCAGEITCVRSDPAFLAWPPRLSTPARLRRPPWGREYAWSLGVAIGTLGIPSIVCARQKSSM